MTGVQTCALPIFNAIRSSVSSIDRCVIPIFLTCFYSLPVSGEIVTIERGERRKVIKITIKPDASQQALEFGRFDLENMDSSEIKDLLLKSGIFAFIKQRPYDIVANPDTTPRDIFVTAFDSAPLAPDYAFILKEEKQHFETDRKSVV